MSKRLDSAGTSATPPDLPPDGKEAGRAIPVADEREGGRGRLTSELLSAATSILLTTDDPDVMLRELFEAIRTPLGIDFFVCYAINDEGNALRMISCSNLPDESRRAIDLPDSVGTGQEAASSKTISADVIVGNVVTILENLGAHACSCHPLMVGSRPIGALGFASRTRDRFDGDEVEVMRSLSHQVTLGYQCLGIVAGLREQDRNKDEFLATLAHELRTPLSAMRNGLQLLRLASDDPAVMLQARSILDRQVQQMIRLVDDLLDVSRVNSNRLELRKEWVELATVVKTAIETSRPAIEASKHELVVMLPTQPVLLDADPLRLAQALSNLLHNAAKYTEAGGKIMLVGEQQGDRVVIRVRDTGMGIPAETLPHVFRMFMQARRSVAKSQGGLGIGLPLVKRLVEMHGGVVSASSDGPGKGSEFTVRLPVLVVPRES